MANRPAVIANAFLKLADDQGVDLSPMQIQKLVYFSHGWHLAFDKGALCSERAQAWRWGPVFPSLYHALKHWGSGAIEERITAPWDVTDEFESNLIARVWEVYGDMTAVALSQLSHDPEGPWQMVRSQSHGDRNVDIPNPMIRKYFQKKLNGN